MKLPLDAALAVRTRPLFADTLLGLEWRRLELGTGRLDARYQITIPASLSNTIEPSEQ